MDISRQLRSTALIFSILAVLSIHLCSARFHGNRLKRQYGAHMYLPESFIIPDGEGDAADWSEWSSPSECSRSCGGGVSYQTRECLRTAFNGAPLCSGGNRKYFSCNTQDCPEDEPDFRAQQCSRFDNVPFDGVLYNWVPYTNAPNPCELNCMPIGERFYFHQKSKVIDGTRCNDKDLDVCVDGVCQPVGCDMMLGSNAKEDKCRKCGGDGSTCKTITDTFTTNNLAAGYNDILLVPSGATNIRIQETAPSNNYVACRNLSGHYYLNGNWRIDFPRPMFFAGSWWNYQRKPAGFAAPDYLTCSGPTTESLYIVVLVQDRNVSINYEYSIPDTVLQNSPEVYSWAHMEFEACSVSCGGGTQSRKVSCTNRLTLQEVDPGLCDAKRKPAETQDCGQQPCAPQWVADEWGKCSKGCGKDGYQNRTVTCERISPNGEQTLEDDEVCLQQVGNKPATMMECNRDVKNCPKYHVGPWKPCDKLCGEGKQIRRVTCYIEENGRKKILPEAECIEEKPPSEKKCMLAPCEGVDWILSQWSGCHACGQNTETRTALCGSKFGKAYPDVFCGTEVPSLSRPCSAPTCPHQWFTSEWSKCSALCGKGKQSRVVLCGLFDGKQVKLASDENECDAASKPSSERECEDEAQQCPGEWFTGPWGACSKPCGGGERVREVLCLANGTKSSNCDQTKLEFASEKCNTHACSDEEVTPAVSTASSIEDEDYSEEEECEDDDDEISKFEVEFITEKNLDGISLDKDTAPLLSLLADELMLNDAPFLEETTVEGSGFSTLEGSGDTTATTDEEFWTEGSGDSTESTTDITYSTTDNSKSTEISDTTDSTTSVTLDLTSTSATDIAESTATGISSETETPPSTIDLLWDTELPSTTDSSSSLSTEWDSETTTENPDASGGTTSSTDSTNELISSDSTATESLESTTLSEFSTTDSEDNTVDSTSEAITDESTLGTSTPDWGSASSSETEFTESTTTEMSQSTEFSTTESRTEETSTATSPADITAESTTDISELPTDTTELSTASSDASDVQSTETTETAITESTDISSATTTTSEETVSTENIETSSIYSSTDVSDSSESTESTTVETSVGTTKPEEASSFDSTETSTFFSTIASTFDDSTAESESTTDSSTDTTSSSESTTTDFWASVDTDTTKEADEEGEESTPNTFEAVVTKRSKLRKCKPKRTKKNCKKSQFGCCPDQVTLAKGPFDEGCSVAKTCADTEFGCCLDGVSPARGKNNKGCPKSQCAQTLFGCCPDKFSPAEGEDNEGCPEATTLPPTTPTTVEANTEFSGIMPESTVGLEETTEVELPYSTQTQYDQNIVVKSCSLATYGCCRDGITEAKGESFMGCDDVLDTKDDCTNSIHGCCADGRTPAPRPDGEGCADCTKEVHGCCPDGLSPAHGPLGEGCCTNSTYGCCPDNINYANGPDFEGCSCTNSPYGCCPDKKTAARGHNNEGCSCELLQFGCCPDKITPAKGPKFEGCACHTMQYGCCPDGVTYAQGPHHYGCHCSQTEFQCCPDEKTPAKGPNAEGCTCLESKYGCCPDGVSSAKGDKFEGCENVQEPRQKACGLPKETGNCSSFAIKYFFDTSYGACARFWYGGCGGNDNKFDTEAECKETCQDFKGAEACYLPKSSGPCTGYNKKWFFSSESNRCEEFSYGGCYGTSNRFDSIEECQALCAVSESLPICEQPMDQGPCQGSFERWFYENETDVCRPFTYGGCKGNKNNYPSEHACNYHCRQPGVHKDYCSLPKQPGECSEQLARWYYSETDRQCMPFYYTGCGANRNNFLSLQSCEDHCPKQVAKSVCEIPAEVGECQNYVSMWYYDTKDERCRQFYYGGCGGNDNKFRTEAECLQRCERQVEEETATKAAPPTALPPAALDAALCQVQPDAGGCSDYRAMWYFDAASSRCQQFFYGGCEGNGNRFESEDACLERCQTSKSRAEPPRSPPLPPVEEENACALEADIGTCDQYVSMWFYNAAEGSCQQFYYGGCGGNGNKFNTETECQERCTRQPPALDSRFGVAGGEEAKPDNSVAAPPPRRDEENCLLPSLSGECESNVTRWFYNRAEGLCDEFIYSGCGGNGNNFETEDDCHNSCAHVQTTCSLPPVQGRCSDRLQRWYFDEGRRDCYEFEFSGCRGNRNNFVTHAECVEFCTEKSLAGEPQEVTAVTAAYSLCELPAVAGDCENSTLAWFYDAETLSCTAFTYSGCGGNGNRFESKEQCDRQCGEFKGIDVCNEPVQTGPCRQWETRFYFNQETRSCEPFTYGGCDGTGNRFVLRAECESLCLIGHEPQTAANKDICKVPVNSGKCEGPSIQERRWYYDDDRGTCISFIYAGCAGNRNNFRSYESCVDFCASTIAAGAVNTLTETASEPNCASYEEECRQLRCPYGTRRVPVAGTVEANCTRCNCENPCEQYSCPAGQQCAVEVSNNTSRQFEPICRLTTKPGECPHFSTASTNCARECYSDADCRGDNKCCTDGCGYACVRPSEPTRPNAQAATTASPTLIYPGDRKAVLEPKKPQEVDVQTSVGGIAVLRCFATGNPAPNVTWSRHSVVIDTNQGRYVLTASGDLTIVQVRQTDSGSYVCVADNGLGAPVQREVQLQVTVSAHATLVRDPRNSYSLGSTVLISCEVQGYPAPNITWTKDGVALHAGERIQITADPHRLVLNEATTEDSGLYGCTARNSFSYHTSEERVAIESVIPIHPDCVDNRFFANCKLIVKGNYCKHQYYAKFCCRSCTLAGQLGGAHLNAV